MGDTNITKDLIKVEIPPKQTLELKRVNDQGDTMVTLDGRFIGYIQWDQRDEFVSEMKSTFGNYF